MKSDQLPEGLRSGGASLERGISSGKTDYEVDRSTWPVNEPVRKIEALYQTSGDAEFTNDLPVRDDEVFCAFVLADAPGVIKDIDASKAMVRGSDLERMVISNYNA